MVLVAALLVLLAREGCDGRIELASIGRLAVLLFWGLDGYFLWQERLFRALYDHVRLLKEADIDFSMDIHPFKTDRARTWLGATLSRTLIGFYGALALVLAITLTIFIC